MINVLGHRQSPGAEPALIPGMVFIAFHFHHSAVPHVELDAASSVAARPRGPDGRPNDLFLLLAGLHTRLLSNRSVISEQKMR